MLHVKEARRYQRRDDPSSTESPMIFGIAAWKAVTIVATSLFIGGVIGASAARNHEWSGDNRGWDSNRCPVHISARDGHRYVRANCT